MNQGREIFDHQVTQLNETAIRVFAVDEPGAGGANHKYEIWIKRKNHTEIVEINFQHGPLREAGVNGLTDQALVAIVLDRLRGFQKGEFSCRENAIALTNFETGLLWTGKRAADRRKRGVEGTNQK